MTDDPLSSTEFTWIVGAVVCVILAVAAGGILAVVENPQRAINAVAVLIGLAIVPYCVGRVALGIANHVRGA